MGSGNQNRDQIRMSALIVATAAPAAAVFILGIGEPSERLTGLTGYGSLAIALGIAIAYGVAVIRAARAILVDEVRHEARRVRQKRHETQEVLKLIWVMALGLICLVMVNMAIPVIIRDIGPDAPMPARETHGPEAPLPNAGSHPDPVPSDGTSQEMGPAETTGQNSEPQEAKDEDAAGPADRPGAPGPAGD